MACPSARASGPADRRHGRPGAEGAAQRTGRLPEGRPRPPPTGNLSGVIVPLQLRTETGILSFISTTTIFCTPVDGTLQEWAIESFFPADAATAQALTALAGRAGEAGTR